MMSLDRDDETSPSQARPVVYGPASIHEASDLRAYLGELVRRRHLVAALARATLADVNLRTWLGHTWLLLNPLLLALVYFLLVAVIRGDVADLDFLAYLVAGLFLYFYTQNSLNYGGSSISRSSGIVLNTALPRLIFPIAAVGSAAILLLPSLGVYALMHVVTAQPLSPALSMIPVLILIQTAMNVGLAGLMATATVFVPDTGRGLPYLTRIWLYLSPVLYRPDDVEGLLPEGLEPIVHLNPLYDLMSAYHQVLSDGLWPTGPQLAFAATWAALLLVTGVSVLRAREGQFALRI